MIKRELNYFGIDEDATWQKHTAMRFGELVTVVGGRNNACQLIGNINPDTVSNWSTGKSRLPLYAANILCQAAGKSLNWLVSGYDDASGSSSPDKVYRIVHELLVEYLEEKNITHVSHSTIAKLCAYLTKRIEQQILEQKNFSLDDISLSAFQEEVSLVIGQ